MSKSVLKKQSTPELKSPKKIPAGRKNQPVAGQTFFDTAERFTERYLTKIFWFTFGIVFLLSILLFDIRVSLTGDDTAYIIRAYDLLHQFTFPGFQGPLYPIVLSPLVAAFGIHLVPLKAFSMICMLGFFYFTFKAFKGRIPSLLLVVMLLLCSVNSFILYYSSQTDVEAFFMFVQALMIFFFFKFFLNNEQAADLKTGIRRHLLTAFLLLLLALTRSVGFIAAGVIAGYFILNKEWKNAWMILVSFGILFGIYTLVKWSLWGDAGLQFAGQGSSLTNKNFYNAAEGKEDLPGYISRLITNSHFYLSRHFYAIAGLRPAGKPLEAIPPLTFFTYLLYFAGLFLSLKKNRYLFFTGLYTGGFLLVTFVILQVSWDQHRLIIPAFPYALLFLFSALYFLFSMRKTKGLQFLLPLAALTVFAGTLGTTSKDVKAARKINGIYYGLTPDWINYLKMSEWASENIPPEFNIGCRKPTISFIYGKGRKFYGIDRVFSHPVEPLFEEWEKNQIPYLAILMEDLQKLQPDAAAVTLLKQGLAAHLIYGKNMFYLVQISDSLRNGLTSKLNDAGVPFYTHPDTLAAHFKQSTENPYMISPDSLLNRLAGANVRYVITASLRAYSDQKTEYTVNTVERYLFHIQDKYPGLFTKESQMGGDNDEPASLIKINYERYGIEFPRKK